MRQWKTSQKKTILDVNKFLKVEQHTIELPNGQIIDDWPWVISPDFALVLAVTERNTLLLFRQVKYAVHGVSFAPVGGYVERGEDSFVAAKRELREEMGCEAPEWIFLGSFPSNGNHGGGNGHLFLALKAHKVCDPIIDDLEEMEPVELTIEETEQKLLEGEIKVLGWQAMLAMGLLYLKKRQ